MTPITTDIPSLINVYIDWAFRHTWSPGQVLRTYPAQRVALWLILQGDVNVRLHGEVFQLSPGKAILMRPEAVRDIITVHGGEWLSVGMRTILLGYIDILQLLPLPIIWQPSTHDFATLRFLMESMAQAYPSHAIADIMLHQGLGRALAGMCWRMLGSDEILTDIHYDFPTWLSRVLREIHDHPDSTVSMLIKLSGYSAIQFRRLFTQYLGVSPQTYIQQHRLQVAQNLLTSTDLSIRTIAERLGFANTSAFTRLFTTKLGISPTQHRQLQHNQSMI